MEEDFGSAHFLATAIKVSFAIDWRVFNQKPIAYYLYENGPEGSLEIPKLTIVHLQELGRSEQGCTSKNLAKFSDQLRRP